MNSGQYISETAKIQDSILGENGKIYNFAEVKSSTLGEYTSIGDQSIILGSHLMGNIAINRRNFIQDSKVGRYTYTGFNTVLRGAEIGNFCSISWNVSVGGKNHDYTRITTSPIWGFHNMDGNRMVSKEIIDKEDRYRYGKDDELCIVGNDVWIAANVVIVRGVTVGNGAVIAAGAVVTKDVEPYTIVAGVPAKPLKKRFSDETIRTLESIQWWNWPREVITKNMDLIYSETVTDKILEKLIEVGRNIGK